MTERFIPTPARIADAQACGINTSGPQWQLKQPEWSTPTVEEILPGDPDYVTPEMLAKEHIEIFGEPPTPLHKNGHGQLDEFGDQLPGAAAVESAAINDGSAWGEPADHEPIPIEEQPPVEPPPIITPPLPFINIARWDHEPIPEQEWSVHNRFPLRQAVLFSGEGAAGKSTIYLHLAAAHALSSVRPIAIDWLNSLPEPGPSLFIECEDDDKVMQRRLAAVGRHYGVTFADMVKGGLHLISLAGQDAVIAAATRNGKIEPTPLFHRIYEAAGDLKPKMIGIASSANVYAGSEIDRSQVQQFASLLTRLAIVAKGTCHLLSHPSLTGINTDTGISGNTQWHNAFRARAYLKSAKTKDGEQPDNDVRELVFKKNNYGSISESVVLRYQNGLFLPAHGIGSLDKMAKEATADDVFIALLTRFARDNRNVSDKTGPTYAPARFAEEKEATKAGLDSKSLAAAMRRLFEVGKIWNEEYGKKSRPHYRLAMKI